MQPSDYLVTLLNHYLLIIVVRQGKIESDHFAIFCAKRMFVTKFNSTEAIDDDLRCSVAPGRGRHPLLASVRIGKWPSASRQVLDIDRTFKTDGQTDKHTD